MQPMQEVYRIPAWPEPPMPQWPQQQPMGAQSGDMQLPVQLQRQQQQQDLAEQQLQRPDWPVRPILPVATVPDQNSALEIVKTAESSVVDGAKSTGNHVKSSEYDDENSTSEDDDDADEKPSTVPPLRKKKQRKHKKDKAAHHKHDEHDRPVHEQLKNIKNGLEIEFMDHDGAAERPGGAVLSLTLGKLFYSLIDAQENTFTQSFS